MAPVKTENPIRHTSALVEGDVPTTTVTLIPLFVLDGSIVQVPPVPAPREGEIVGAAEFDTNVPAVGCEEADNTATVDAVPELPYAGPSTICPAVLTITFPFVSAVVEFVPPFAIGRVVDGPSIICPPELIINLPLVRAVTEFVPPFAIGRVVDGPSTIFPPELVINLPFVRAVTEFVPPYEIGSVVTGPSTICPPALVIKWPFARANPAFVPPLATGSIP